MRNGETTPRGVKTDTHKPECNEIPFGQVCPNEVFFAQNVESFDVARTLNCFTKAEISEGAFDLFFSLIDFLNLRLCLIVSPIKLHCELALDPCHPWRVPQLFESSLFGHVIHMFLERLSSRYLLHECVTKRLDFLLR